MRQLGGVLLDLLKLLRLRKPELRQLAAGGVLMVLLRSPVAQLPLACELSLGKVAEEVAEGFKKFPRAAVKLSPCS